jgi:hypothetical protein
LFDALGNLGNGCAAAARRVLDRSPGLTNGEHAGDTVVAFRIFRAAPIATLRLGLGLTLCLPAAPIVVGRSGMPRVNPSDEIDTVAYAVSFMKAAKRLAEEEEWEDNLQRRHQA